MKVGRDGGVLSEAVGRAEQGCRTLAMGLPSRDSKGGGHKKHTLGLHKVTLKISAPRNTPSACASPVSSLNSRLCLLFDERSCSPRPPRRLLFIYLPCQHATGRSFRASRSPFDTSTLRSSDTVSQHMMLRMTITYNSEHRRRPRGVGYYSHQRR